MILIYNFNQLITSTHGKGIVDGLQRASFWLKSLKSKNLSFIKNSFNRLDDSDFIFISSKFFIHLINRLQLKAIQNL